MPGVLDPNPPPGRCPRTGLPVYPTKVKLNKVLRAAVAAGVPGAADLEIKPCPSCAGLHLVAKPDPIAVPVKTKQRKRCRKRPYKNETEALAVAAYLRASGLEHRQEKRAYRCRYCNGAWHLTSEDKKGGAARGATG